MIHSLLARLRQPSILLATAVILLCIGLQVADLQLQLRFDREAIAQGAWWRLLSGNLVHLGPTHLAMNVAGFLLVIALVWHHFSALQWLLLIILSSLFVSSGLYLLNPHLHWYVGFSGTLHGLILAGCLADLKPFPRSAGLLLVLIGGKLGWEQWHGALPGSESVAGGRVVVDAHLYGAIGGALAGTLMLLLRYRTTKARS